MCRDQSGEFTCGYSHLKVKRINQGCGSLVSQWLLHFFNNSFLSFCLFNWSLGFQNYSCLKNKTKHKTQRVTEFTVIKWWKKCESNMQLRLWCVLDNTQWHQNNYQFNGKIRRKLYHLYEHVLSKMRTARINGSRLISVLDLFSCECCP